MKKSIAILLTLCLAFSLMSGFAQEDIQGDWYLLHANRNGQPENPAMNGMTLLLRFHADGSGEAINIHTQSKKEDSNPFTWENKDGKLSMLSGGETASMQLEDGLLKLDTPVGLMVFGRQVPPVPVPAESAEAFRGEWRLSNISADGLLVEAKDYPSVGQGILHGTLSIDDASASVNVQFGEEELAFEGPFSFSDGKLSIDLPNDLDPITVYMMDNETLFIELQAADVTLPLYFIPSETAES